MAIGTFCWVLRMTANGHDEWWSSRGWSTSRAEAEEFSTQSAGEYFLAHLETDRTVTVAKSVRTGSGS